MKMSGADFRAFLNCNDPDIWPEGLYIEEELLRVNGIEDEIAAEYKDSDVVEIIGGALAWDDLKKDRESLPSSLKALAKKWQKLQSESRVIVTVPNDKIEQLEAFAKTIGAKVVR